ncbi:hypothetical protein KL86DES1_20491 [uncultured Desulfovibrio sp.]|uniref:Uncharacterized protein n=1 Tax=uncultured Desulfovibrio sp. TaxID=167968 RepID=A0A212L417_9BACT|nr:hypothetical protein KL86DES1_20491 [uncultured Desulfovibrio sp.]VZH33394.1 conserved protein of unknown function [Desulfovibrio sp. 86]
MHLKDAHWPVVVRDSAAAAPTPLRPASARQPPGLGILRTGTR